MATDYHRETSAAPSDFAAATGGAAVDQSLFAGARALEPTICQHADTTERERRLARPVLQAMREAGPFRMFTPRTLGGLEPDPVHGGASRRRSGESRQRSGMGARDGRTSLSGLEPEFGFVAF